MGAAATPLRTIETPEHPRPPRRIRSRKLFEPEIVRDALKQSFVMLRPDIQWSNPVMFVVEIGAVLTLLFIIQALVSTSASQVPITYFIAPGLLAVPDGAVCEFCDGSRGGTRQGSG